LGGLVDESTEDSQAQPKVLPDHEGETERAVSKEVGESSHSAKQSESWNARDRQVNEVIVARSQAKEEMLDREVDVSYHAKGLRCDNK